MTTTTNDTLSPAVIALYSRVARGQVNKALRSLLGVKCLPDVREYYFVSAAKLNEMLGDDDDYGPYRFGRVQLELTFTEWSRLHDMLRDAGVDVEMY
jgi:hypothetical protein